MGGSVAGTLFGIGGVMESIGQSSLNQLHHGLAAQQQSSSTSNAKNNLIYYPPSLAGCAATLSNKEQKMGFIKEYFVKHRELFMGLALAIILDRYLLGGAFQERLKRIITSLLDKTETALHIEPKA